MATRRIRKKGRKTRRYKKKNGGVFSVFKFAKPGKNPTTPRSASNINTTYFNDPLKKKIANMLESKYTDEAYKELIDNLKKNNKKEIIDMIKQEGETPLELLQFFPQDYNQNKVLEQKYKDLKQIYDDHTPRSTKSHKR